MFKTNSTRFIYIYIKKLISNIEPQPDTSSTGSTTPSPSTPSTPSTTTVLPDDRKGIFSKYIWDIRTSLNINYNFLAILITGTRTVEALTSDGDSLCVLKEELPYRRDHTMDGDLLCGGNTRGSPAQPVKRKRKYAHDRSLSRKGRALSCLRFSKGSWASLPFGLNTQRKHHSSWKLPGIIQFLTRSI